MLVYACEYRTGGTIRTTLRQRQPDGSVRSESFEERGFPCGPTATHQYLPFGAFDPGTAQLSAEIEMDDPNYSTYQGEVTVVRRASRTVRIR